MFFKIFAWYVPVLTSQRYFDKLAGWLWKSF